MSRALVVATRAACVALVLMTGCASPDPAAARRRIEAPGRAPVRAAAAAVPAVHSARDDDCGPATLTAALLAAGFACGVDEVRVAVFDPARGGSPATALQRHAQARGAFALVRSRWYLDDLAAWVRAGVAPIVALWAGPGAFHFVLLTGYDEDRRVVLLRDQAGEVAMTYDAFFPRWCEARGWALVVADPSIVLPANDGPDLDARELGALGWLAEQRGDLAAAARHYRAALARDPGFEAAAVNLANVEARAAAGSRP